MSPRVLHAGRVRGSSTIECIVLTALGALAGCNATRTMASPPVQTHAETAPRAVAAEPQPASAPAETAKPESAAPEPPPQPPPEPPPPHLEPAMPAPVPPASSAGAATAAASKAPCACAQPVPKARPKKHKLKRKAVVPPPEPQSVGPAPALTDAVVDAEEGRIEGPLTSILGKDVFSPKGENLGRVVDLLADSEGRVRVAIIDFGGFLGVGTRRIAVDWPLLHFTPGDKDKSLRLTVTREKLQSAPEYKGSDSPRVLVPTATPDAAGAGTHK